MSEYAPSAIQWLFSEIQRAIPAAVLSGIVGDQAHTYGYHRGRNYLPPDDYSVQVPEDRAGDGDAACGLDISWSSGDWQRICSQRLLEAANDSRMHACREFYGSADGVTVCGWDFYNGHPSSSDPSHLWHIHLSILRQYANDDAALQGIAEVMTGGAGSGALPPHEIGEDDDMSAQDVSQIKEHDDHNTELVIYGDGKDVPANKNTHPENLRNIRSDVGKALDQGELILYGDGRDSSEAGTNTHPFNLYDMNKKLDRILSLLGE